MAIFSKISDPCDRHLCLATVDKLLASYLYAGTPNARFREELARDFPVEFARDEKYLKGNGAKRPVHDFTDPGIFGQEEGKLLLRIFLVLASDYYRPVRLASLYSTLYPDEYYNPVSSPNRIHQVLKRLRQVLRRKKLPLEIKEKGGGYYLDSTQSHSLRLPTGRGVANIQDPRLGKLRQKYSHQSFSCKEAVGVLKLSTRTVSRLLLSCVREGKLIKSGKTAKARFSFPS